jgi:hypothetical protein
MTSVVARLGLTKLSSTISSGGLTKGDTKGDKSRSGACSARFVPFSISL